jgi:hypothetical protein
MALVHVNATTATTAQPLFTLPSGLHCTAVQICNNHTAVLYIGGSAVSTTGATRGSQIAVNASQQVWLNSGDTVYAITAAASATGAISIIYSGI